MREFSQMDECKFTPKLHEIIVLKEENGVDIKCVFLVMEHIQASLLDIIRSHELTQD